MSERLGKDEQAPITEDECIKIGGHCWNIHYGNDVVDKFGNIKPGIQHLVNYGSNPPKFRTCRHCGKRQQYHKTEGWD